MITIIFILLDNDAFFLMDFRVVIKIYSMSVIVSLILLLVTYLF